MKKILLIVSLLLVTTFCHSQSFNKVIKATFIKYVNGRWIDGESSYPDNMFIIMEYLDKEIKTLILTDTTIEITYDNDIIEIINKNGDGYKNLYNAWLLEQPMFISDIYKMQMRDLNFAARNNEESINNLNIFLSNDNYDEALKFITYMRKRDLTFERKRWNLLNNINI